MKRGDVMSSCTLPEGCLAEILSKTTPRDACRLSLTSSAFNSAAQADSVWSAFLPADVDEIISPVANQLQLLPLSRRELYFRLCMFPVILPNSMIFSLEKENGKKCYMIPSTMLFNAIGEIPNEWKWTPSIKSGTDSVLTFSPGSRIGLIQGKIQASVLSPGMCYTAYLVCEVQETASDYYPISVGVNIVKTAKGGIKAIIENRANLTAEPPLIVPIPRCWNYPQFRDDGWMEVQMAVFFNDDVDEDDEDDEVEFFLKSSKALVSTLYLHGVEFRPTESNDNDAVRENFWP